MMHLNYSIFTCCWIVLLLFIMSYEMRKVFAFLKFSITLLLYLNQILPNPRNCHLLVSHFPFVVLSPMTKRGRKVCTSVNLWFIIVHPKSFYHITLNAQSTKLLQQMPYLLSGVCHQLMDFSMIVIKQLLLCFSFCSIASFSRGLDKDSCVLLQLYTCSLILLITSFH